MPLVKSHGNMYPWVTHMHTHLGGECQHKCSYCYVDSPRFGRPAEYTGPLRPIPSEFKVRYGDRFGSGRTIFIDHKNDLFANAVPNGTIMDVLHHCLQYPRETYVFQTKNPIRYKEFRAFIPPNNLLGCTIETNRLIPKAISVAPAPFLRAAAMMELAGEFHTFITIEPIMDFDVEVLSQWLMEITPDFINIGADSKRHKLPEPPPEKILELIANLTDFGIEIRGKYNLARLIGKQEPHL